MRRSNTDYLTIAGAAIFMLLSLAYLSMGYISQAFSNLSFKMDLAGYNMPDLNPGAFMDAFNALDGATQLLYIFVITLVAASTLGCFGTYFFYRKVTGRR